MTEFNVSFDAFCFVTSVYSLKDLARARKPLRFLRETLRITGNEAKEIVERAFLTRLSVEVGETNESLKPHIH